MYNSLKTKAVSGVFWSGVQKATIMVLGFITSIILARLLTPNDYGLIGMLGVFLVVCNSFIEGGFGPALIQKVHPSNVDYTTVFVWNIGFSIFSYSILYWLAPFVSSFFHQPDLVRILRVLGVILIVNAVRIVHVNQIKKQLLFKKIAIIEISAALIGFITAILLAFYKYGVWSLVWQQIITYTLLTVVYWIASGWTPSFVFSWRSFREMFGFGFFILLSNLLNSLFNNIQGLLIGRFYSATTMGYYSKAQHTEDLASGFFSQVVSQVSFPVLSYAQENMPRFRKILKSFIIIVSFITFPSMLGLILLAGPIIVLLYSDKWVDCVPYFKVLCIAGIFYSLESIYYYAIVALGKGKIVFKYTMLKRAVGLLLICFSFFVGNIVGLLWGIVLASFFAYCVNVFLASKYVDYSFLSQFNDIFPIMLISITAFSLAFFFPLYFSSYDITHISWYPIAIFLSSYVVLSFLFCKSAINALHEFVSVMRIKKSNVE